MGVFKPEVAAVFGVEAFLMVERLTNCLEWMIGPGQACPKKAVSTPHGGGKACRHQTGGCNPSHMTTTPPMVPKIKPRKLLKTVNHKVIG